MLRPQDLPEGFQPTDDTWYYARVAGTFKERQGFHGCQMPEQLLGRIIRVSSNPGDIVLDPFAGSGTTLAVAKKLGRSWLGCELSEEYTRAATERLNAIEEGAALDGPADPIGSAPSTVNGRKLGDESSSTISVSLRRSRLRQKSTALAMPRLAKLAARDGPRRNRRIRSTRLTTAIRSTGCWPIRSCKPRFTRPAAKRASSAARPIGIASCCVSARRASFPKRGPIQKVHVADDELDRYSFAAEIAWRLAKDKFPDVSLDEIFCDPAKATYFDRTAKRFAPGFEPVQYRWAALRLRKASRELVDEVKQYHFVFSKRDFSRFLNMARSEAEAAQRAAGDLPAARRVEDASVRRPNHRPWPPAGSARRVQRNWQFD